MNDAPDPVLIDRRELARAAELVLRTPDGPGLWPLPAGLYAADPERTERVRLAARLAALIVTRPRAPRA